MNQTALMRDAPENRRVFPTRANDPSDFFQPCPRLRRNVLLDEANHCLQPKESVCSGCVCLGFRDVDERTSKR